MMNNFNLCKVVYFLFGTFFFMISVICNFLYNIYLICLCHMCEGSQSGGV